MNLEMQAMRDALNDDYRNALGDIAGVIGYTKTEVVVRIAPVQLLVPQMVADTLHITITRYWDEPEDSSVEVVAQGYYVKKDGTRDRRISTTAKTMVPNDLAGKWVVESHLH